MSPLRGFCLSGRARYYNHITPSVFCLVSNVNRQTSTLEPQPLCHPFGVFVCRVVHGIIIISPLRGYTNHKALTPPKESLGRTSNGDVRCKRLTNVQLFDLQPNFKSRTSNR